MAVKEKARILVVDDDKSLADNMKVYLEKIGHQATAVYGGNEAVEAFRNGVYDLVITDLMMPEVDGMDLVDAVRIIDPKAIVLVITGYATVESAVEAIKRGAFDFIPKPFKLEELEIIVKRALERRAMSKQLGLFRGISLALVVSVPVWLLLGILLAVLW